MNKRASALLLFIIIAAFFVFALLKFSNEDNRFFENYLKNAENNIESIMNLFSDILGNSDNTKKAKNPALSETSPAPANTPSDVSAPPVPSPTLADAPSDVSASPVPSAPAASSAPVSANEIENGVLNVSFENANNIKYVAYKNYLVCANKTSLMAFDKYGASKWAVAVSFSKPILKTAGNYILLADKGGKLINLFIGQRLVYSINTDNVINYASVSSKGEVVVITEKEQYRSCVMVYNNEGNVIFSRNIGSNEVIAADLSPARYLSAVLLNTDTGVSSQVQIWDINSGSEYSGIIDFNDTLVFDVVFSGETLSVLADNGIYGLNHKCKNIWTVAPESASDKIVSTRSDSSGRRITVFDNNAHSYITISDLHNTKRKNISSEIIPDFASIYSSSIAYNNGRKVFFGRYNHPLYSYTSDKDISDGMLIAPDALVLIHSNSLEFININKFSDALKQQQVSG